MSIVPSTQCGGDGAMKNSPAHTPELSSDVRRPRVVVHMYMQVPLSGQMRGGTGMTPVINVHACRREYAQETA